MPTFADYAATRRLRFPQGEPSHRRAITAITVCLNARSSIERAIDSIRAQAGEDVEHIVVDGGSTDGTAEIVRKYLRPGDFLLSEPDRGISDALNKGLALANGELVQLVHADDWLAPGQLATGRAAIASTGADFVFGDLLFYEGGQQSFRYRGDPDYAGSIDRRMPALNHPTVLARRSCFERIGLFDLRYRCAMDYDWLLRLHRAGGRGVYVPEICGNMNHDGVSNTRFARTMREVAEISVVNGRPAALAYAAMTWQIAKIATGRVVKRHAEPLYRLARRSLNPSYRPLD